MPGGSAGPVSIPTLHPMRIVLVNWAKIRDGASVGGGVNGYCQAAALELIRQGHEVVSLCGGSRFDAPPPPPTPPTPRPPSSPAAPGQPGPCRIERLPDWEGVHAYEVVNSPVLAPSLAQFQDPMGEVSAPALEALVRDLMAEIRPDVVHFHNIEGFSVGCIAGVRAGAPGARVVFSLHNYHTICPQVYLMQGHRRPCRNFDNGHACASCVPTTDPRVLRRRWVEEGRRQGGGGGTGGVGGTMDGRRLKSAVRGAARPAYRTLRRIARRVLGRESGGAEHGASGHRPGRGPHPWSGADIPAWRPLLNVIQPEPASDRPPNDYARRREAMVGMLNSCDQVLAVSEFVRAKFESLGVDPEVIRTLHIGSRMTELVADRPPPPPPPPPRPLGEFTGRPIRVAFMGYNNWYKGLPMLADSLSLLVPEVLARIHLHVFALGGEHMEEQLRELEPMLGGLTLRHGYRYEEVPDLLAGIDLGLVTSVWWDNGPQTVMEFMACGIPVLAAELGGIPDFVRDGENGLLFRGNDRYDLARRLAGIVARPTVISELRRNVRPPKTMAAHIAELERIYARQAILTG